MLCPWPGHLYFSVVYDEDEMRHPKIETWRYRGLVGGKHLFDGISQPAEWAFEEPELEFIYDLDGLFEHLNLWAERCPEVAPPKEGAAGSPNA